MKIKRILGFIFALSLAVSVVSCGFSSPLRTDNKVSNETTAVSSELTELNEDYLIKDYCEQVKVSDADLTWAFPIGLLADKVYYYQNFDPPEEEPSEVSNYIVDLTNGSVFRDEKDYSEKSIIYTDDKTEVYLDMDERLVSHDLISEITKTSESSFENIWYTDTDKYGNIYIFDGNRILYCYSSALELIYEYDLSGPLRKGIKLPFDNMLVTDEGKVYFVIRDDDCFIYVLNENGVLSPLTDRTESTPDYPECFYTDNDGNLVISSGMAAIHTEAYDPESGKSVYSFDNYSVEKVIGHSEKYDIVYLKSDGIYGYNYKDDSEELIVSDDVLPRLSYSFEYGEINKNTLYLSLSDSSPESSKIYEIDRNTGETIISDCNELEDSCLADDGTIYYVTAMNQLKGTEDGETYETVVRHFYRHNNNENDTMLFALPEFPNVTVWTHMIINSSGELMITYSDNDWRTHVQVYSLDGELKNTIDMPHEEGSYDDCYLVHNENNQDYIILRSGNEKKNYIYKYNRDNCELEEAGVCDYSVIFEKGFGSYDLTYMNDTGVYGWKDNGNTNDLLMAFEDPEIKYHTWIYDDNELYCSYGIKYVKADEKRLKELNSREVISLSASNMYTLFPLVYKFNEENDRYFVLTKDYSELVNEEIINSEILKDKNLKYVKKLDEDIKNNEAPDLILLDNIDASDYIINGFFTDMKKIAENDPQYDFSDIYPTVKEAFTYKDCMYTIPSAVNRNVLFSSDKHEKWNFDELLSMSGSETPVFQFDNSIYNFLSVKLFTIYANDHTDIENRKCDFDNESFVSLLEFLKDNSFTEDDYEDIWDNSNRTGRSYQLLWQDICSASDYIIAVGMSHDEYSSYTPYVTGWPSLNGSVSIIEPHLAFGIPEKSEHKDAAWEFIKFVNSEYCTNGENSGYPVYAITSISMSEKYQISKQEINMWKETYPDEFDEQEFRSIYSMPAVTDVLSKKVISIISEEAENFMSGQMSAEETAKTIQNKVTLYLNEIS